MKSEYKSKKTFFRTSTFFCFCMMLVCFVFVFMISNIAVSSIETQVIQKENVRLGDIQLALNNQITSIHKFSLNVASNNDLRRDIYMLRQNDKTKLTDIQKNINMYMNGCGYELDYLIFIDDTNYCISRGGILEKDIAERIYVTENNMIGKKNWELINNGEFKNMYINIPNQYNENTYYGNMAKQLKLSKICYILTIMNPYKTEPMANIMVSLNEEQIFGGIKNLESTHYAAIIDPNGQSLLSYGNMVYDGEMTEVKKIVFNQDKNSSGCTDKYIVVSSQSEINNYTCFLLADKNEVEKDVRSLKFKCQFLIIALFALQIMLSIRYIREYRMSINRIKRKLHNSVSGRDDIYSLEKCVDKAIENYSSSFTEIKIKNNKLRYKAIYNALVHDIIYDCYEMTDVEKQIKSDMYAVSICYVKSFGDIMSENDKSRTAAIYCIQNVIEELFLNKYKLFVLPQSDMVICLIGISSEKCTAFYDDIEAILEQISDFFSEQLETKIVSSVSEMLNFENFATMYHEASECIQDIIIGDSDDNYLSYDKLKLSRKNLKSSGDAFAERLYGAVFAGEKENAVKILEDEFDFIENDVLQGKLKKKFLLTKLLLAVMDICEKIDNNLYNELIRYMPGVEKAVFKNEYGELKHYVEQRIIKACEIVNVELHNTSGVPQKLIKTIEEHYLDPEFSSQTLADIHNLSVNYVLSLVKNHTGISFVDYLNSMRVNHAKELLVSTDYPISKIYEMSGFASITTFNRVFRKSTGISAGKWREINK